tara:strand:+ start:115 stop:606 length:492 start_codon:yes stop_codon:yes gene_type:complete
MELFDYSIIVISFILLFIGIIGSVLPGIPGPIISYLSILLMNFIIDENSFNSLLLMGVMVVIFSIFENFIQFYGVKFFGGKKLAIIGSTIGFLVGLIIPPAGFIIGTFLGGLVGALIENKQDTKKAFKIALGSFIGFFVSVFLKLVISFYFVVEYFNILMKLF